MKHPTLLFLFLAASSHLCSQPKVHPFENPPVLTENTPAAAPLAASSVRTGLPQTCNPKGSVTRQGNIVTAALNLVRADFTINNPDPTDQYGGEDPVTLRSYGGCKSGPVIEVSPGNTLRVDFVNSLPADDPSCLKNPPSGLDLSDSPGAGCFNTTNLHTHGLHVSPSGNSDNVLLNIGPQTTFPYEVNLPADHPAGTFWYHAHRHGSVAVQVASGVAGMLVIRGNRPYTPPTPANPHPIADIDTILHDAKGSPLQERLFTFQQIAYACFNNDPSLKGGPWQQIFTTQGIYDINASNNGTPPANAPWTCPTPAQQKFVSRGAVENFALQLDSPTIWDTNGHFTSVNGIVQPTMTIPAGEIQRWRFLHAGIHDTINLQIVRVTPAAGAANPIANSALSGNRQQQRASVVAACPATPQTLIPMFEIAADGLTRTKLRALGGLGGPGAIGSNYMQPGYRSDVLIAFPSDGDYCLLDQAAPANERANNGNGPGGQGPSQQQLLAYIHVRGGTAVTGDLQTYILQSLQAANPQLPDPVRQGLLKGDISPWAPFIELAAPPAANLVTAQFAISNTGVFGINSVPYNPDVVNVKRQVNTTDDWLLSSLFEPHIFHIHINPVEIVDVTQTVNGQQVSIFDKDGNCKPSMFDSQGLANQYCAMYHVFKDTVFVENNFQVRVRTHYDRYIGEFVMHCHILDHEDGGMMWNVELVPDIAAPGGGIGMSGMNHKQ